MCRGHRSLKAAASRCKTGCRGGAPPGGVWGASPPTRFLFLGVGRPCAGRSRLSMEMHGGREAAEAYVRGRHGPPRRASRWGWGENGVQGHVLSAAEGRRPAGGRAGGGRTPQAEAWGMRERRGLSNGRVGAGCRGGAPPGAGGGCPPTALLFLGVGRRCDLTPGAVWLRGGRTLPLSVDREGGVGGTTRRLPEVATADWRRPRDGFFRRVFPVRPGNLRTASNVVFDSGGPACI
jgi:hypothetical protein